MFYKNSLSTHLGSIRGRQRLSVCFLFVFASLFLLTSCTQNPLTGSWADSVGNRLYLAADLQFVLKTKMNFTDVEYTGTYKVMHNVLVFSISDGRQLVGEWDVRGIILYVDVPIPSLTDSLKLILYKTGT